MIQSIFSSLLFSKSDQDMPALHLSPTLNFSHSYSKYLFSWITSLFQLSIPGPQIWDLHVKLVFILLMDEFSGCGNTPLPWNRESKNNPMQTMFVLWVGRCDTLRLLSIFKKNRIIDILDCSKAGLNTLPFNIRTKVFSPLSKSVSSLELYLYPFPLTSSGNLHTYFMFLKVNHFISVFLWHLNTKRRSTIEQIFPLILVPP